ncbi:cytochrome C oxidase subunit IV family protein [Nocardioides humilatus]|uniref:Cytochrome C oxidase subunit IV family protein n=1 Tax=Nocardioides humilatus TaxID=2607660 RepID=A0A5B1LMW5_9ACTN|nr:cytochrome C oxidase subunit IV family protein [Nocardioides humilatus]KAA1421854.1 cytochrome C oxidase subunit IV family protein [Nocardioides humilatus]
MTSLTSLASSRTPADLLRTSATAVWIFLVVATVTSWALGTDHAFVDNTTAASVVVLLLAFVKVRFVGLYFMELKDAPLPLRALIEAWCLIVCALTVGFFLAG